MSGSESVYRHGKPDRSFNLIIGLFNYIFGPEKISVMVKSKSPRTLKIGLGNSAAATIVILIVVAVAGPFIYFYGGQVFDTFYPDAPASGLGGLSGVQPTGTTQPTGYRQYNVGFTYTERNAFSGAAETTTTPVYAVYDPAPGTSLTQVTSLYDLVQQGQAKFAGTIASGATATIFPMLESNGNRYWIRVDAGTGHVVDTSQLPGAITAWKMLPVSHPVNLQLIIEVDFSKSQPNFAVDPQIRYNLAWQLLPVDTTILLTTSVPADQDSLGTTANTAVTIRWTADGVTANQGVLLARIYITSNQTTAFGTFSHLSFSGVLPINLITGQRVTTMPLYITGKTASGVAQTWTAHPITNGAEGDYTKFTNALALTNPTGSDGSTLITLHGAVSFVAATDAITAVLNAQEISSLDALQTANTDSATLGG